GYGSLPGNRQPRVLAKGRRPKCGHGSAVRPVRPHSICRSRSVRSLALLSFALPNDVQSGGRFAFRVLRFAFFNAIFFTKWKPLVFEGSYVSFFGFRSRIRSPSSKWMY